MNPNIIVRVNESRQILLTPEIAEELQIGDHYQVVFTSDSIILKKIEAPLVDLDQFFDNLEQMPPDPQELGLQEISNIVKEMRREKRAKNESSS